MPEGAAHTCSREFNWLGWNRFFIPFCQTPCSFRKQTCIQCMCQTCCGKKLSSTKEMNTEMLHLIRLNSKVLLNLISVPSHSLSPIFSPPAPFFTCMFSCSQGVVILVETNDSSEVFGRNCFFFSFQWHTSNKELWGNSHNAIQI